MIVIMILIMIMIMIMIIIMINIMIKPARRRRTGLYQVMLKDVCYWFFLSAVG